MMRSASVEGCFFGAPMSVLLIVGRDAVLERVRMASVSLLFTTLVDPPVFMSVTVTCPF